MTPDAIAVASASTSTADLAPTVTLLTIEERTRAIAEVAEGLRPLIAALKADLLPRLYWHGVLRGRT